MMTTTLEPQREPLPPTDEALLLQYRDTGNEDAFRELVQRYERELFHYLWRYLHDAGRAEEVFQAAFLRLYQHRYDFRAGQRVRPWLYTIATRLAIDVLRHAARRPAVSLDAEHGDDATLKLLAAGQSESPEEQAERQEQRQWLRDAITKLPQRLHDALQLVYFNGLTYDDAARRLGIPLGTLKSRLHESLVKLNRAARRTRNGWSTPNWPQGTCLRSGIRNVN